MKLPIRLILCTLLTCSLSGAAGAAEPVAGKEAQSPSPLPAAAPTTVTETRKQPEPAPVQQAVRLGHVDLMRIATESEKGKAGQAQLTELKKKMTGQVETKRKQLEKQKAAIEAKLQTLTPQQREAKGKEFQKKVEEFQKFGMNAEKELQERLEEYNSALYRAIEQASAEYGKANNLALVVVKREMLYLGSGVDAQDVTDGVIKLIDKK
jgi:outer membrane protein